MHMFYKESVNWNFLAFLFCGRKGRNELQKERGNVLSDAEIISLPTIW